MIFRNFLFNKVTLLVVISLCIYTIFIYNYYSLLSHEHYNQKREQAHNNVAIAIDVLDFFYQEQQIGNITQAEAQRYASLSLSKAVSSEQSYIWLTTKKGVLITQPFLPNHLNKNIINWQSATGTYVVKQVIESAVENEVGAWHTYDFPQPGHPITQLHEKHSFVKYYKPWGWVVGSGYYDEEIQLTMLKKLMLILVILVPALVSFMMLMIYNCKLHKQSRETNLE